MANSTIKVVLLAGGMGTRISEETGIKPKPLIEVGGRPILWHIMKMYANYGITDFIVCCGYKGYLIKEYFANYFLHMSDVTFDMRSNSMEVHQKFAEPWRVTVVDTGESTMTGGRLLRVKPYLEGCDYFCMTYGDGLSDVNIAELINFHRKTGVSATLTAAYPPGRFGALDFDGHMVSTFIEKPQGDGGMVSSGFFVLEPSVFELISSDKTVWEQYPLQELARRGQLAGYKHEGFFQPMDTLRDKVHLEDLWRSGKAPWRTWD